VACAGRDSAYICRGDNWGGGTKRTNAPIEALVVEDDILVVRAIRRVLGPDFHTRHAATKNAALDALRRSASLRLVLIDIRLGNDERAGLDLLDVAASERPEVIRAVVTGSDDATIQHAAAQRGALMIPKPFPDTAFDSLISRARASVEEVVERLARDWRLTAAQQRIVTAFAERRNCSRSEVASALAISENTVRAHVHAVLTRTRFRNMDARVAEVHRARAEALT
jgi:DNA-binding NarL/FixJ family response regulator